MTIQHASDCAVHNMPAYPSGPCDCFADLRRDVVDFPTGEISVDSKEIAALLDAYDGITSRDVT